MQTALSQNKEQNKSEAFANSPTNDTKVDLKEETGSGKEAGLPLFLQRSTLYSPASSPPIQRQPVLEEEEPLGFSDSEFPIQAKLTVGAPDDEYEQEANRIADQVMRMPAPAIQPKPTRPFANNSPRGDEEQSLQAKILCDQSTPLIQQQVELKDDKEEEPAQAKLTGGAIIQRQVVGKEEVARQAKEASGKKISAGSGPALPLRPVKGGGQPLAPSARSFFEPRFGADFSKVRVHNGAKEAQAAGGINARAYTLHNDIVFGSGQYQPDSTSGRHLLAHELTHTLQQSAVQRSTTPFSNVQSYIQRYSLDDFVSDAESVGESVMEAGETVVEGVTGAGEAIYEAGETVVETVGEAGETIVETAGEAVDWLVSTAGKAALESANALAGLFGGSVVIRGTCLIVTIPEIPLFPSFQKTLAASPPYGIYVPLLGGGAMIGPIPVAGTFGILAYGQLSAEAAVGPGVLRGIRVEICPLAGRYMGTAQLYIAAAIAPRLTLFGGIAAAGGTILPFTPPVPVVVILQGGLRATGTGWLIGALRDTVTVLYSGGMLSFTNVAELMGGVLLQGDLDLFAALRLYDQIICQYVHPLGHWEAGRAMQLTIPMHASLGGGSGGAGIGPVTWGEIPIGDIETAIKPLEAGWSCLGWDKIKKILCDKGVLLPELCEEEGEESGIAGTTYACAICKCQGDKECGGGRIYTIWMGKTECNRENKKEAQRLCNHDSTFLRICDLDQNRPDGKKCSVHHHDFACSDRETKDKCEDRKQSLGEEDRHEPSPRVPMLPEEVAERAQRHIDRENYAAALEVVVSGLRLNLNLCYFTYVNRTDAGEGLTTTDFHLDPATGNYVPDGPSRVEIYSPAFATLQWLVSTVMHEYQHVLQHQRGMTEEELDDPTGEHTTAREVEAYLWEIENALGTGLAADIPRIQETGTRLTEHYDRLGQINPTRQAQYTQRYNAAVQFVADLETGPPPLPGYPNIYHHGTDYDTAQIIYTSDIEARGRVDFGLGFYTHTKENWQLAKEWALRKAVSERKRGWGVVTFPVPTDLWDGHISSVLIYRDQYDLPPNAPVNPDTGNQMNWREFVRYNFRKEQEGNLPTWPEYNIIRGPLYGGLSGTDIRQVMFTSSGTPLLNIEEVRALRIAVLRLFRRRHGP